MKFLLKNLETHAILSQKSPITTEPTTVLQSRKSNENMAEVLDDSPP